MRLLLAFSLIFLLSCQPVAVGRATNSVRWEPFSQGLPGYALTLTVAADPSQPGVIYAGTYHPPGLWRSDDDGQTWLRDDQGLENQPVFTLHWDPVRSWWWAGAGDGLYSRSTQGEAWQPINLPRNPAYALAQDRGGAQLVLALAGAGLFLSADGETWSPLPIGQRSAESNPLALAVSPDSQDLYVGTAGDGLWISRDAGASWSSVPQMADDYVSALLVDPEAGAWAYARTLKQVYRSDDGGRTWAPVSDLDRRAYGFALGADGAHYVALKGQVARSDDGGLHWMFFDDGLHPGTDVLDLAVASYAPPLSPPLVGGKEGGVLYAAAWEGFYRSKDGGRTWRRCSEGLGNVEVDALAWDGQGRLLAGTSMGIYRRAPDADEWEPLPQGLQDRRVHVFEGDPDGRIFYAGTDGGLSRSEDGGQTWVEVTSGLTGRSMPDLAVDPQSPEHLYIRLRFERVYESWDGGQNWEARWEGLGAAREVISIDLDSSGLLMAGANDGLFRWACPEHSRRERDEGLWQRVAPELEGQTVFTVVIDPRDEALVYAGATDGLWRSQDGGDSWDRWGKGLAGITVTAVGLDPADERVAYAGTMYEGLYVTEDGGATWQPVGHGVPATASVRAILLSPALSEPKGPDGQQVYVATDQGVFRRRPS